jgi:phage protein D
LPGERLASTRKARKNAVRQGDSALFHSQLKYFARFAPNRRAARLRNRVCRDDSKIYRRMVATQNESRDARLCLRRNAAGRNTTFAIRPY